MAEANTIAKYFWPHQPLVKIPFTITGKKSLMFGKFLQASLKKKEHRSYL